MNKVTIRKMALAIGLTFVAIGVWAQDAMLSDSIADKVTLHDGESPTAAATGTER